MGLFHKQADATDDTADIEQHFMDENFREELRNHGRWYFEKVINENGALFKKDLDATIEQLKVDLRQSVSQQVTDAVAQLGASLQDHITSQLDAQFVEYSKTMKSAQDEALASITKSAHSLTEEYRHLSTTVQKDLAEQEAVLSGAIEESKTRIATVADAQTAAIQWINHSTQALQEHDAQLTALLQKNLADQQALLVRSFEGNMAQIIEHYILGALGDQYDLKAQLPAIIKQMEANKQTIVDDMKV